ncbi:MAG: hypothetical protein LR015_08160 [Verrucomicrobia bacterium]|nr:hypothetical protein [Verrucomicrobiota bacterium]
MVSASSTPASIAAITPAEGTELNNVPMSVQGAGFVLGSDVLLRRQGSPVVQAYRVIPLGDRIDFHMDLQGIDPGFYDVVVRAPDGTESILPNGFLMPISGSATGIHVLYSNTFESADGLSLTGAWQVGVPNQASVSGPGSAFVGSQVLGTYLNGNYENNINITATLPPFSTVNRTNVRLEYRRWLGLAYLLSGNPNNRHRDDARVHYSLDGINWQKIWENSSAFNDSSWTQQSIDLPSAANNRSQVFIRFQLQTDNTQVSYGFNIDDLKITAESQGPLIPPSVYFRTGCHGAGRGTLPLCHHCH